MNQSRVNRVVELMKRDHLPCILVSATESVYYLTGRWISPGERMLALVITDKGDVRLFANKLFWRTRCRRTWAHWALTSAGRAIF